MMHQEETVLRLDRVSKEFASIEGQKISALQEINLDVAKGEFVSVIGPSGCGKTTLLRIIAGLEKPSSGDVSFHGGTQAEGELNIGLIFQEFALFPWRTVLENIELGLEIRGIDKAARRRKALEYVAIIELEGFEKKYPKELSGGMKQRVAIARSIICNPRILLMDEPFGSLDAQTRFTMQKFLFGIWKKTGKTIIFVTHNVDEAVFLGQRLIVMSSRPGKILSETTLNLDYPRDINSQEFVEIRKNALQQLENGEVRKTLIPS